MLPLAGSTSAPAAGCCHWQHSARIDLGAGGELSVAARNTLPRIDLGAGGELGVATGNTLPRIDLGAGGGWVLPLANSAKIDLGAGGSWVLPLATL
ncbi:hypothetical protein [Pseudomonas aeruginosa]|uniref:hypothetical protein n=1 Tax=Pseudomonas aeruginosa TaxID=287 RepID=UPI00233F0DED|nr:hypothetical protein [Pseudomonas aeruginosa]WCI61947.1 hypothetical protein PMJ94_27490 [Pseudomonas aeruginosa]